ncbi:M81 family metallopeptidase [uncultured Nisaea sp.]|uniref:M81 family metallopeptidase n=1 Tax=uncultured Nisaea sp. TaxID=538215 RepID=UPI0030EDF604|tara:strand:+ start:352 stop:1848 length:1497 start_codon:yes stop_codon:yes gene_type:complete
MTTRRVLSAEISHETNTFSVLRTGMDAYLRRQCYFGDEIAKHMSGTATEVAAHIDAARTYGWELIPTVAAHATPSGMTTADAWEELCNIVLAGLDTGPVDGVMLALHGAMVTETSQDAEGDLLKRLRDRLGKHVPIAVTLDLHANVTDGMAELADILRPYRTYPHIDQYEAATEAASLLQRAMDKEIRPVTVVARRPTLDGLNHGRTQEGPMVELLARAAEIKAADPAILEIGLCAGFAWSDIAEAGPSVSVTTDGDAEKGRKIANELMQFVWDTRAINTVPLLSLTELSARIKDGPTGKGPLVIGDTTDNPGGGGYGDGVRLLEAIIATGTPNAALAAICDPAIAEQAHKAGAGARISISLGAKVDPGSYGPPIGTEATVLALSETGAFVCDGPMWANMEVRLGRSALLDISGVKVVIASSNLQVTDQQALKLFGLDPAALDVIAVKSSHHFRAAFQPVARDVVLVDSGCLVSQDYASFNYRHLRRPIWPIDPEAGK